MLDAAATRGLRLALAAAVEPRGEGPFEASHRRGETTIRGREGIAAATAGHADKSLAAMLREFLERKEQVELLSAGRLTPLENLVLFVEPIRFASTVRFDLERTYSFHEDLIEKCAHARADTSSMSPAHHSIAPLALSTHRRIQVVSIVARARVR